LLWKEEWGKKCYSQMNDLEGEKKIFYQTWINRVARKYFRVQQMHPQKEKKRRTWGAKKRGVCGVKTPVLPKENKGKKAKGNWG